VRTAHYRSAYTPFHILTNKEQVVSTLMNTERARRTVLRQAAGFLILLPALVLTSSCASEAPVSLEPEGRASMASSASSVKAHAPFPVWHQGFEHDTRGWYGAETPEALGWCGTIERKTRAAADHPPSAGRAYAAVAGGPCNKYWSALGVPYGGPYGPGPELSLYSGVWPASGYVTELDIYLDPAWSSDHVGTFAPGTLIEYGATIFPLAPEPGAFHTGPHYFVGVAAEDEVLAVLGHRIIEPGWYTFRFVFNDVDGHIRVAFELRERRGSLLVEEVIDPVHLMGPVRVPFEEQLRTSQWGSGHVWFFDIAAGLQLPIDEYRVRQGR
jgi:hypothetical protein